MEGEIIYRTRVLSYSTPLVICHRDCSPKTGLPTLTTPTIVFYHRSSLIAHVSCKYPTLDIILGSSAIPHDTTLRYRDSLEIFITTSRRKYSRETDSLRLSFLVSVYSLLSASTSCSQHPLIVYLLNVSSFSYHIFGMA